MAQQWFRVWHGVCEDGKWRTVARLSETRVADVLAVMLYLWERCSKSDERGSILGIDWEVVSDVLGIDPNAIERIRTQLIARRVISDEERISSWEKYQPKREDDSAARAKAWRDNNKKQQVNSDKTQANASERKITLDKDKDTDKDKEEEKKTTTIVVVKEKALVAADAAQPPKVKDPRGSFLPDDFVLPDEWGEWAEKNGLPFDEITLQAQRFKNYWWGKAGANGRKKDWFATWRNWVLDDLKKYNREQQLKSERAKRYG